MQPTATHPTTTIPTPTRDLIRLSPGYTHHVVPHGQVILVVRGYAWISSEGKDHVLRPGETLTLPPEGTDAIMSALEDQPVTYFVGNAA